MASSCTASIVWLSSCSWQQTQVQISCLTGCHLVRSQLRRQHALPQEQSSPDTFSHGRRAIWTRTLNNASRVLGSDRHLISEVTWARPETYGQLSVVYVLETSRRLDLEPVSCQYQCSLLRSHFWSHQILLLWWHNLHWSINISLIVYFAKRLECFIGNI